jgi:hypothetical protein
MNENLVLKNKGNKLKKLIFSVILLAAATSSYACISYYTADEKIMAIIENNGGNSISTKNCELLNNNNMGIIISGKSTVLSNTSIGWVVVKIFDKNNNITSATSSVSTGANSSYASMDKANELMYLSLKDALKKLDYQKAIQEVKAYRAKALK